MCCFKIKMSAPKRLTDSKLESIKTITIIGIQDKNTKSSIKSKNCLKSKTLRELENLEID